MIRFILCQGIGFSPGSTQYVPTLGFSSGTPPVAGLGEAAMYALLLRRRRRLVGLERA